MTMIADPAAINGDRQLSSGEHRAYMQFHRQRNAENAAKSRQERVVTLPGPGDAAFNPAWSPARHDAAAFFSWVGRLAFERFGPEPITIIDLGCGAGFTAPHLADAGLAGDYVGIDIAQRKNWSDQPIGPLRPSLIVGDIATLDLELIPRADLIVSATALEHIEDDRGAIERLRSRLSPRGIHAHFVPGEAALDLYGPHGWRQYSPRCLHAIFPTGDIFRFGGAGTNRLHASLITRPTSRGQRDGRSRHPLLYAKALRRARAIDASLEWNPASMYAVLVDPERQRRGS
jgi:SAM-dependent methyltransferase